MDRAALFEVAEATWPPERRFQEGPWTFRQSNGGGKRVTAASCDHKVSLADIHVAEAKMEAMGQQVLFTLDPDHEYDSILAENGYEMSDPTQLYHCDIDILASRQVPSVTAFPIWPPLQLARDIWADGGIGPDRVAVMERAQCERTAILGRVNDRAGGVVYAGLHKGCVMIHALEILTGQRRFGLATSLMIAAAQWGAARGATSFALLVTKQNAGANALYTSLGMAAQDGYHYRVKP